VDVFSAASEVSKSTEDPDLFDIYPDYRADFTTAALEIRRALRSLDSGGASGDSRRGMCILSLLTFQESLLAHCFVVMPFSSPISSLPCMHPQLRKVT